MRRPDSPSDPQHRRNGPRATIWTASQSTRSRLKGSIIDTRFARIYTTPPIETSMIQDGYAANPGRTAFPEGKLPPGSEAANKKGRRSTQLASVYRLNIVDGPKTAHDRPILRRELKIIPPMISGSYRFTAASIWLCGRTSAVARSMPARRVQIRCSPGSTGGVCRASLRYPSCLCA